MHNYLIHLAVKFIKDGKTFNQFAESEIAAYVSDDELRSVWNAAWFAVGMTEKVNKQIIDTTNYNRATAYFRAMEMVHPEDEKWGAFADAMDKMMSTTIPVIRCKECKFWSNDGIIKSCKKHLGFGYFENWFCADGEKKDG